MRQPWGTAQTYCLNNDQIMKKEVIGGGRKYDGEAACRLIALRPASPVRKSKRMISERRTYFFFVFLAFFFVAIDGLLVYAISNYVTRCFPISKNNFHHERVRVRGARASRASRILFEHRDHGCSCLEKGDSSG